MNPEDIIIKPIITEKTSNDLSMGKYTFRVAKKATKIQIAGAVESIFGVKVLKVTTMSVRGKKKTVGVHKGKTPDWKKAIVKIDVNPSESSYLSKGGKAVTIDKKYKDSIEEFSV